MRPLPPQITPISTFCIAFHTFVIGKWRDFKFGRQVDHIIYILRTTNRLERGVVTVILKF